MELYSTALTETWASADLDPVELCDSARKPRGDDFDSGKFDCLTEDAKRRCEQKKGVSYLFEHNLELNGRVRFRNQVWDLADEPTVQRWLQIEEDRDFLKFSVQFAAQAMQPV